MARLGFKLIERKPKRFIFWVVSNKKSSSSGFHLEPTRKESPTMGEPSFDQSVNTEVKWWSWGFITLEKKWKKGLPGGIATVRPRVLAIITISFQETLYYRKPLALQLWITECQLVPLIGRARLVSRQGLRWEKPWVCRGDSTRLVSRLGQGSLMLIIECHLDPLMVKSARVVSRQDLWWLPRRGIWKCMKCTHSV